MYFGVAHRDAEPVPARAEGVPVKRGVLRLRPWPRKQRWIPRRGEAKANWVTMRPSVLCNLDDVHVVAL